MSLFRYSRLVGEFGDRVRFFRSDRAVVVGVSGGRTSAMLAALVVAGGSDARFVFQNTGMEHPRTYDFLKDLEVLLGRKIVWLEYQRPSEKGAPMRESRFRVVDYSCADRSGGPFEEMMSAYAEYRAAKGERPLAPWARARFCTSYLKLRTQDKWEASLGLEAPMVKFAGLRADEPHRVTRLVHLRGARAPLAEAGIIKADVLSYWARQSFDLHVEERQGNCTGCFLKDQSDLSRTLPERESNLAVWARMEQEYDNFGGKNFAGYATLAGEFEPRLRIEAALRAGVDPVNDGSMEAHRFKYVVIQERKRLKGLLPSFSCNCEGAETIASSDDD